MNTVYKYPFEMKPTFKLRMPAGAMVLTVQMQGDSPKHLAGPAMWAVVDSEAELEERDFLILATGQAIPADVTLLPIGTFQTAGKLGVEVYHLFEKIGPMKAMLMNMGMGGRKWTA